MEKDLNPALHHFHKSELRAMVGNNDEFIKVLINTFFDGFYDYLKNIRTAIKEQSQSDLKLNAHSITGSAKSVYFEILATIAFDIENSKVEEVDKLHDLIEDLENEIEIIKDLTSDL
jgi:HPt (histidine-containing phosphotransfer) domain-containing protein